MASTTAVIEQSNETLLPHGSVVSSSSFRPVVFYGGVDRYANKTTGEVWLQSVGRPMFAPHLATMQWTRRVAGESRIYHTAVAVGNTMVVFGGAMAYASSSNDVYIYDVEGDSWERKDPKGPHPNMRTITQLQPSVPPR